METPAFELYADINILYVQKKSPVTSGSANVYPVRIRFKRGWDELDKRCVFRAGSDEPIAVLQDEEGICNIPWEVLETPGKPLYAGVYGTNIDGTVLPTIWACLGNVLPGASPGESGKPPTPDAWEELKDDLKKAHEALGKMEEYVDDAAESADSATQSAGSAADSASKAKNSENAAADSAAKALASQTAAKTSETNAKNSEKAAETAQGNAESSATAAAGSASDAAESADTAKQYSGNPPIIRNGTWWTWDAEAQDYADTGYAARGNVMYATFLVDPRTGDLYMYTDEEYRGPDFRLVGNDLEVVLTYG